MLKVFLRHIMHKADNVTLFVDCYKASIYRDKVFHIIKVIAAKDLVALLNS